MSEQQANSADLLRAALRETTGDPAVDAMLHSSLLAGIVGDDPELLGVFLEETAPPQAQFDLHLTGATVVEHTAEAKPLGNFMRYASQAVNEIAKSISSVNRLGDRLLVEPGPGSVRLTMRVPTPSDSQEAMSAQVPTVESKAIDVLASLFEQAEDDELDSPLPATIQRLSPKARGQIRLLARTAQKEGWNIEGNVSRRGSVARHVTLTSRGAARLETEAGTEEASSKPVELFGEIDGHIRSEALMSFIPEGGRKFRASVMDADLMAVVAQLAAVEGQRVHAVFDLFERVPLGQSEVTRRSYTLRSVNPAPSSVQTRLG